MALFGKLFEKKNCVICNKELGLFGKTKISEGYICKECDGKLSPYFTAYRSATADDIRAQLAYRENNKTEVAGFRVTRTLGNNTKVYLDEDQSKLIISTSDPNSWGERNPDVLEFSQVTGCNYEVRETRTEIKRSDAEGNEVSYNPPRYDIDYDIYVTVHVSHPYVGQIEFKVNRSRIETRGSAEYRQAEELAHEIKEALTGAHDRRRTAVPQTPVTCPSCLATTVPDDTCCCPYCGSSLASVVEVQPQDNQRDDDERDDRHDAGRRHEDRYYGERDYAERDYGEVDYGERDYGEGRSPVYHQQTNRAQQQATSQVRHHATDQTRTTASTARQGSATGAAKADFHRQQATHQGQQQTTSASRSQSATTARQGSATGAAKADFHRQQGSSQQQSAGQRQQQSASQNKQQSTGKGAEASRKTNVTGKAKEDFRRNNR